MIKIANRIIYLIVLLTSPLFLVFILLIRYKKIVRLWAITADRIGHFAGNVEMILNSKKEIDQKKYLEICYFSGEICNEFLADKWRQKLIVFPMQIIHPLLKLLNFLSKYISIFKDHILYDTSFYSRDYNNHIDKFMPTLKLDKAELANGENMLKKFGLKKEDKFVCFIVRDDEYLKQKFPNKDWSYWNYRDYDIENFLPAAEELTKLGYYVFRMGKICKKRIVSKNKMIIDYAFSEKKNDFLDIYLGANCEFCLTTDVGFDLVPSIFRRPLASITDPISLMKLSSKKYLNIFSNYFSVKESRNLNLQEIFNNKIGYFKGEKTINDKGIKLIKPNSDDIKFFVLDMVKFIKNDFKISEIEDSMNSAFIDIYLKNVNSEDFLKDLRFSTNNKIKKLHNNINGKISPSFLKKRSFLIR